MSQPGYRFTPSRSLEGASPLGNSYLSQWAQCPRAWYNTYLRSEQYGDQVSTGITPAYRKPSLSFGSIIHAGLEEWYRSGCRDGADTGEYSIEAAIEAARLVHLRGVEAYESGERAEEDWLSIQGLLRAYHDRYGPASPSPDWPSIGVLHDTEGKPLIERELWTPLDGTRMYTCRADLLVSHFGNIKVMEHKTSAPGMWVKQRLASIHTDSQMTGEFFVIAQEFPELPLNGVLVNVLVKGAAKGKPVAERETTNRTPEDLRTFKAASLSILAQIDEATGNFAAQLEAGVSVSDAVDTHFPDHGQRTGHCQAYGGCTFLPLCHRKADEDVELRMFRPRVLDEKPTLALEST